MPRQARFFWRVMFLSLWLCCSILFCASAQSDGPPAQEVKFVSLSVLVKARPEVVFDSIRRSRHTDPQRRKVLTYNGCQAVIEEHFAGLPVLGAATCVYREDEVPLERIDYSLIRSSQFRKFQGRWELAPAAGDCTLLKLSSYIDPVIWVPFKEQITRGVTTKDIQRRLAAVKADAESR